MTEEKDQPTGETLPPEEFELGEEEAFEEQETERAAAIKAAAPKAQGGRRFGIFGRKAVVQDQHGISNAADSVRGAHAERVHIDDRASAIFALVCALGLVGVMGLSLLIAKMPKAAVPTMAPLQLESFSPLPTASGGASVAPTPTVAPTVAPTATPTVAPTATPAPTASPS